MANGVSYADAYYDPSNPGSFGGVDRLLRAVGHNRRQEAEEWLASQETYTLHKPARKRVKRNVIRVAGLDDQWEADLVDVQSIAKYNNRYRFLLTCIDVLSKYAFVIPLKDKTGDSVVKAFQRVFKERKPRKLRTDSGKEFLNRKVQQFLKSQDVVFFTSNNDTKCAVIERFNRTLRAKMWRYFTAVGKERYADVLSRLVEGYNAAVHSTTGVAPSEVNVMNAEKIWRKVYNYRDRGRYSRKKKKKKRARFNPGDVVRISKAKGTFEKGYRTNWTRELFKVVRRYKSSSDDLPEYSLEDLQGESIKGRFVEGELQRAVDAQKKKRRR